MSEELARKKFEVAGLRAALRAIVARIDGEFDNDALLGFGPLSIDSEVDIRQIAADALLAYKYSS